MIVLSNVSPPSFKCCSNHFVQAQWWRIPPARIGTENEISAWAGEAAKDGRTEQCWPAGWPDVGRTDSVAHVVYAADELPHVDSVRTTTDRARATNDHATNDRTHAKSNNLCAWFSTIPRISTTATTARCCSDPRSVPSVFKYFMHFSFFIHYSIINEHMVHDQLCIIIPEQFTVKAHPALFDGEGSQKRWHYYSSLQFTYTFKTLKQTAKAHTLALCAFIIIIS